jgi:hypothetical protein
MRVYSAACSGRGGEAHLVQHEAPPDQPAQQAVGQHQEGLVGEAAVGRVGDAVVQAQLGPRALHHQLARHLVQKDREAAQDALDGALHRRAGDDGLAHQGIAAHLHAAAVQAEELVVQGPAHRQPQGREGRGRHPRMGHAQPLGRDAGGGQGLQLGRRRQLGHRRTDEVHRDRVLFDVIDFVHAAPSLAWGGIIPPEARVPGIRRPASCVSAAHRPGDQGVQVAVVAQAQGLGLGRAQRRVGGEQAFDLRVRRVLHQGGRSAPKRRARPCTTASIVRRSTGIW